MKPRRLEKEEKLRRTGTGAPAGSTKIAGVYREGTGQCWRDFTEKMAWMPGARPQGGIGPTERGIVDTGILSRVNQAIWTMRKRRKVERTVCTPQVELEAVMAVGIQET